jgi:CheY-like chemotaxis protein
MPKVLLVSPQDPSGELAGSVLYRSDVERVLVTDPDKVVPTAKHSLPNLVVIKGHLPKACEMLARQLRSAKETRRTSIVVLLRAGAGADEAALQRAGASLVVSGPFDPLAWDDRIEDLLSEPRRRDAPVPVRFVVWPAGAERTEDGLAVNLSVRGMLLESPAAIAIGSTLELAFQLPTGSPTAAVGQVVRQAIDDGKRRYGVDFIILRGNSRTHIEGFVASEATRR